MVRSLLALCALMAIAASPRAQATPLDKLFGKSLSAGNFIFSNFSAPTFVGAGPSSIDVQAVLSTDPSTGAQQAGLRFTVLPGPFVLSPNGGPHEIGFWIDYSITDTTGGRLSSLTMSNDYSVSGQAGATFWNTASPSQAVADGSLADPTLTIVQICDWFGSVCASSSNVASAGTFVESTGAKSASAALVPSSTIYVQHEVDLQISNRKGVTGGTTTLASFLALFGE